MKNEVAYKPTILQRGLTLTFTPLILGVVTLAVLEHVWFETKHISDTELRHIKITGHINRAIRHWGTYTDQYSRTFFMHFDHDESVLDAARAKIQSELNEAKSLCTESSDDANDVKIVRELEELFAADDKEGRASKSHSSLLSSYLQYNTGEGPKDAHEPELQKLMAVSMQSVCSKKIQQRDILVQRLKSITESRAAIDDTLRKFVYVVATIAGINVVISFALAWFVSNPIAQRMKVLKRSAQEFQQGNFQVENLHTRDEFFYLQSVLRNSFESIFAAVRHRQMILSMVAHDMRAPLMSAVLSLNLMEENADGFPGEAIDKLMLVYDHLAEVLKSANSMLSTPTASSVEPFALSYGIAGLQSNQPSQPENSTAQGGLFDLILKPRLFHQILALIVLPLVVQTIFLCEIGLKAVQVHRVTERVRHFNDVLVSTNIMMLDSVIAGTQKAINYITDDSVSQTAATNFFAEAFAESTKLQRMVDDDPTAKHYLSLSRMELERIRRRLMDGPRPDSFVQTAYMLKTVGQLHDTSKVGTTSRKMETAWISRNFDELDKASMRIKNLEASISTTFSLGYGFYVSAEILVMLTFVLTINKRMRLLLKRAAKVGQLDAEVDVSTDKGLDEISSLQRVLDLADAKLHEANKQRKKMTNSLSRNLSEPLRMASADEAVFAELAKDNLPPKSESYLSESIQNVEQVKSVLIDLQTVEELTAREVKLDLPSFAVDDFISEAVVSVAGLAREKNITIHSSSPPIQLVADRRQLMRVVINIIGNAVKFSDAGSTVEVTGQCENAMMNLSIADNGPGLSEADQKRIFDLGYQAKSKQREHGHGLGLAIAKLLIEAHFGSVTVKSGRNRGCIFTVAIPVTSKA